MFNFTILTGPLFTAGLLNGLNKRTDLNFQPDPRAHYKIMGMTIGMGSVLGLHQYFKENHPHTKSRVSAHLIGGGVAGFLISGSAYCMGLMLTKIPSKTTFE